MAVTLSNLNPFQKFFHWQTRWFFGHSCFTR